MISFENALPALIQNAEALTGVKLPEDVRCRQGQGLSLELSAYGAHLDIAAEDVSALSRALFLAGRALREGRLPCHVQQNRRFRHLGPMLDVSRGAVLKPEAVRGIIDRVSALGMNMLMLYTEDMIALKDYPYFGYLRGRYSEEDIRALDAYAASMGVELVPCIQTLGHLSQFLQWGAERELSDQPAVLMIDSDETYRFIEAEIDTVSRLFTSRRIHIGMDEAHGVGLGKYLEKHGQSDRFDLLSRHLRRVSDMCKSRGLQCMMWSDMFFRLGSKTNDYYDLDADIPQRAVDAIPEGMELAYWDYYHTDEAFYDRMLERHEAMGVPVFAGGAWTWSGFLPQVKRTLGTMLPALKVCARRGVDTVLATLWGDDGAETNLTLALGLLSVFSEISWQGEDCPLCEIQAMAALSGGIPWAALEAFGEFYPGVEDVRTGKAILWCDPLYPLVPGGDEAIAAAANRARLALAALSQCPASLETRYAISVFEALLDKAQWHLTLRKNYSDCPRDAFAREVRARVDGLIQRYEALSALHRELWMRDNKPFGWEVLCRRYGGAIARLKDVRQSAEDYAAGCINHLPELEEPLLDPTRAYGNQSYNALAGPSASLI